MARRSTAVRTSSASTGPSSASPVVGRIERVTAGRPYVLFAEMSSPVPARVSSALSLAQLEAAAERRQAALLLFERGRLDRPIVVALLEEPHLAAVPALIESQPERPAHPVEATVDGKRVRILGAEEVVLQCGAASITLRRNGRVVIRGTHVETESEGVNRIKGATVKIN